MRLESELVLLPLSRSAGVWFRPSCSLIPDCCLPPADGGVPWCVFVLCGDLQSVFFFFFNFLWCHIGCAQSHFTHGVCPYVSLCDDPSCQYWPAGRVVHFWNDLLFSAPFPVCCILTPYSCALILDWRSNLWHVVAERGSKIKYELWSESKHFSTAGCLDTDSWCFTSFWLDWVIYCCVFSHCFPNFPCICKRRKNIYL